MNAWLKLIRPHQWLKNTFVFIPLFFAGAITDMGQLTLAALTFCAYCLVASSIYCLNDVIDVEADRRHPVKCRRPVASGVVKVWQAYALMAVLPVASAVLLVAGKVPWQTMGILVGYWLMNFAYCAKLKQYAILDVCIVAFGFVLRIFAGSWATGIVATNWLVLMTFLLTLFLSFAKRRDDVLRMNQTGEAPRKNTIRYNLTFINQAITITASVTLVCYIMYTVSPEVTARFNSEQVYLTSVFVLLGLLRYIQLAVVDEKSGDPTKVILKDPFTQLVVLGWLMAFAVIIYM